MWTQQEAVELCRKVEMICPEFGCHVALTGGALYKDGRRKDVDIVFYRIRQQPKINIEGLRIALRRHGLDVHTQHGWMWKASYAGSSTAAKSVDVLFPETPRRTFKEWVSDFFADTEKGPY